MPLHDRRCWSSVLKAPWNWELVFTCSPSHTKPQAFSCAAGCEGPQPCSSSRPTPPSRPWNKSKVESQLVGLGNQGRAPHGDPALALALLALGSGWAKAAQVALGIRKRSTPGKTGEINQELTRLNVMGSVEGKVSWWIFIAKTSKNFLSDVCLTVISVKDERIEFIFSSEK